MKRERPELVGAVRPAPAKKEAKMGYREGRRAFEDVRAARVEAGGSGTHQKRQAVCSRAA